jgi:16S rRNA (uracil1498-N3)-methyltransferase
MLFDPMGEKVASEELSQIFVRAKKKSVTIFIGPEGGFTDEERVRAREEGCTVLAGLPSVLRAETAAIVFPAILGFLSNS